jgi:carboxypeptidase Taq
MIGHCCRFYSVPDLIRETIAKGDLGKVTGWLKEKIHRHASFKKAGALFEEVCGKFDAKYYIDYLTEKYEKLYQL